MTLTPPTAHRVDEFIAQAQSAGRTPALVGAVVRDGGLVHFTAAGVDPATGWVPTADTQFRIGSITKTLTATVVMQLRDEGRLALDDVLDHHLPGTPLGSAITIRQLLGHVSGLQREPDGPWWERVDGPGLDGLLDGLTPAKVAYPPHRSYHYSNLAYGLLGAVVHRVTGQDWTAQLTKRLLEPLGMGRTTHLEAEPFARGYVVHPWTGALREEPRADTAAMAPAGQLWSTATDLAKWAAFLADPDPGLLDPATVAEMCVPVVISDLDSWTTGHGLGLELVRSGERIYAGHGGSMPGYLAHLLVHRPSRTAAMLFANAYSLHEARISTLNTRLLDLVLDSEPARPAVWKPPAARPDHELAGPWWWMGRQAIAHVEAGAEGDELVLTPVSPAGAPWRFTPEGTDVWRCHSGSNDGEVMRVRRTPAGVPSELDIATFVHTRQP
jgi:CubicO group peptidase (beta-lactamase class C family)